MADWQSLTNAYEKGTSDGLGSLSSNERELYLIQDFILEWEMGGLSAYFYNRLPDVHLVAETVAAMRNHGLEALAERLNHALELFRDYTDSIAPSTWGNVLKQYDPNERLSFLDAQINELPGYGIPR